MIDCSLCGSSDVRKIPAEVSWNIYHCNVCSFRFVGPETFLSPEKEKERYCLHQNSIEDQGYLDFLNQVVQPVMPFLKPGMRILDYGCGPTPALQHLLNQIGFSCEIYDPFFYPNIPQGKFDVIFSTEAFEHFFAPGKEIEKLANLLNPGGLLGIMTLFYPENEEDFYKWYYLRDPSHVCFYNEKVFEHICGKWGFGKVFSDGKRVEVLTKSVL